MHIDEIPKKFRLTLLSLTLAFAFPLAASSATTDNVMRCGNPGDAAKNSKAVYACLTQGNVVCESGSVKGQPGKICRWPNGGVVQYATGPGIRPTFESVGRVPVDCAPDKEGAYGYGGTVCTAR